MRQPPLRCSVGYCSQSIREIPSDVSPSQEVKMISHLLSRGPKRYPPPHPGKMGNHQIWGHQLSCAWSQSHRHGAVGLSQGEASPTWAFQYNVFSEKQPGNVPHSAKRLERQPLVEPKILVDDSSFVSPGNTNPGPKYCWCPITYAFKPSQRTPLKTHTVIHNV